MSRFNRRRRAAAAEVTSAKLLPATKAEIERQAQDFLAGTVFAAGAALLTPHGAGGAIPPVFVIVLDDTAFGPCPQLREVFALLDEPDAEFERTAARVRAAVGWAVLAAPGREPLAKLKLDVLDPVPASARIVLLAANYQQFLFEAAAGGVLGVTTADRLARIPVQAGASPGLEQLIAAYDWPSQ